MLTLCHHFQDVAFLGLFYRIIFHDPLIFHVDLLQFRLELLTILLPLFLLLNLFLGFLFPLLPIILWLGFLRQLEVVPHVWICLIKANLQFLIQVVGNASIQVLHWLDVELIVVLIGIRLNWAILLNISQKFFIFGMWFDIVTFLDAIKFIRHIRMRILV